MDSISNSVNHGHREENGSSKNISNNVIDEEDSKSDMENDTMYYEQECSKNDDDDDSGEESDYEYLPLNHMPVSVEINEEKIDLNEEKNKINEENYEGVSHGNLKVNTDTAGKRKRKRRRRRYFCEEDKIKWRKAAARERARKYRESLTPEQRDILKAKIRERTKKRRMLMTEEETELMKHKNREQAQLRRLYKKQALPQSDLDTTGELDTTGMLETSGELDPSAELESTLAMIKTEHEEIQVDQVKEQKILTIREKNRERMRQKRSNMTEEERSIERAKNRERVRKKREMQKAETLLKKIMAAPGNAEDKSIKEKEHFLQTLINVNNDDKEETETRLESLSEEQVAHNVVQLYQDQLRQEEQLKEDQLN